MQPCSPNVRLWLGWDKTLFLTISEKMSGGIQFNELSHKFTQIWSDVYSKCTIIFRYGFTQTNQFFF